MTALDMDSNLIVAETIDEFARDEGILGKVEEITKKEISGNFNFEQTLVEWVGVIGKLLPKMITYAVCKIHPMPIVAELILYFKSRSYRDTMISDRFTKSAAEACKALNNNLVISKELLVEDSCLKRKVVGLIKHSNPREAFEKLILFSRFPPERVVVTEEGANNAHIFEKVVFAIALNIKYIICGYAAVVIIDKILKQLSLFLNLFLMNFVIRHSMSTANSRTTKMPAFLLDREAQ